MKLSKETKYTCQWAIKLAIETFNERIEYINLKKELDDLIPKNAEELINSYQSWIKEMIEAYKELEGIDL